MRTAIMTGASGYIGSHLAKELIRQGWSVHAIVRPLSAIDALNGSDGLTIHVHDGTTDGMIDIMKQAEDASVVIHLASFFRAEHCTSEVEPLIQSNVLFAAQLVEAMCAVGIRNLINTGTSWQHYRDEAYNPVCLYAATKQAFEAILKYYVEARSLSVINLKLFDTYGPNDPRPKLFTLLRRAAASGLPLAMSPGEQLLDLVYIDDVVEAYLVAIEFMLGKMQPLLEDYAVTSGQHLSLQEIAAIYSKVTGVELPIQWGGRAYRDREVMVPWTKGQVLPGWVPRVDLETGIRRMEMNSARGHSFV
ncbi:NAD-dependent epimerase/dehydratase family protein [Cohnella thermotolerans]|uniref:NAD-dependent epimerase/dehydratase family protein n=1 Tax=Cohnella thermotolerans TaxID=329858 RepID=UPI0004013C3B|nr:NAD(P)-dependent oxidoreductase [Cohnella thermotolerans]